MANGQQIAEQNLSAFLAWVAGKTDVDFREYVHRGKLKRSEIASECGFGKSALTQNPAIRTALEQLEGDLRVSGVLPPLVDRPNTNDSFTPRGEERKARLNTQRLNSLEQENASLRAELLAAKALLEQYSLMATFLAETGRVPR
ncbi:VPA1267 family protein [Pseudomonas aeruginosa]|uniref:VPA1267 family protein n=1 Tax=Pseudomonas aeruginosa TaxID=287 RepID=UPI001A1E1892|nr:VPA1267 family protein [Pseudomonas aeruginosa]MBG7282134.1 hypothetical protein [Pseudomonas aeruginosa]MDI3829414.1 VPA1267 family protein [Pseudomonas aeruginosa]MDU0686167.1 VPA1267 family protein [Pseudomonas aeruginosa]HBN9565048.1 hypothetical protein [Pseudomonas aeruginosa]HBO3132178.1 hypothetical protein [Pseudomonas aeruginosa]